MIPDPTAKQLSFEKTLSTYSASMFAQEANRKQMLEAKAQFYLTLITALLTAIYFSLPFLGVLQNIMHNSKVIPFWQVAITVLLISLGIAFLLSFISILQVIRIQEYHSGYPAPPGPALLAPGPDTFTVSDEVGLLHFTTRITLEALEQNRIRNNKKFIWAKMTSYCVLCSIIILSLFLSTSIYLQVYIIAPH
jgi:hypothetical protein